MVYYINESVKYSSKIPSNVFITEDMKFKEMCKYPMIIVGEKHNNDMIKYYDNLMKIKKPEYLICEFGDMDRVLDRNTLKDRIDNATIGDFTNKSPHADWYYNCWLYELAYKYNCKLIGCNPVRKNQFKTLQKEYEFRESYMIKTIKEFEGKNAIVQLGDGHIRSIPISKEFNDYTGTYKDDRGFVKEITVDFASPVWEYFANNKNACICRVKSEYENELNFLKSKGL